MLEMESQRVHEVNKSIGSYDDVTEYLWSLVTTGLVPHTVRPPPHAAYSVAAQERKKLTRFHVPFASHFGRGKVGVQVLPGPGDHVSNWRPVKELVGRGVVVIVSFMVYSRSTRQ